MKLEVQIMDVRDPVCGMLFPLAQAVTTTTIGNSTYYFCSEGCGSSFMADPTRHLDQGTRGGSHARGVPSGDLRQGTSSTRQIPDRGVLDTAQGDACPYCHEITPADRGSGIGVGGVHIHELETLVRNEWRRRLGPDSYHRHHPVGLIRGIALCVIHPGSRVIEDHLESRMWDVVAELLAEGKNRKHIQREFGELVMALRAVLRDNDVAWDLILDLTNPVRLKLEAALGWPGGLAVSSKNWDA